MIDKRLIQKSFLFDEYKNDKFFIDYWFDFKKGKFLHNIDTFYYSVKFKNDFRHDTQDIAVLKFRRFFNNLRAETYDFGTSPFYLLGFDSNLDFCNMRFGKYYNIWLSKYESYDFIFASSVPSNSDGDESVTPELIVQIRSYPLWLYGTYKSYMDSFKYVEIIAGYFGLEIDYTLENRCDFAFHSNYLQNPEYFFSPENFAKKQVSRFKGANMHYSFKGVSDYEVDYVALGKRSDKVFVRCYLKSKEVIEMGYKPWFLKLWLLNGLISRYDFYVYERAFNKHSWNYIDIARLEYYLEFGNNEEYKKQCKNIIEAENKPSYDVIKILADKLTPKINLVVNVEYQVMRKHSKTYMLIPYNQNNNGIHRRVLDFLDNRPIIIEYLTHNVLRLVDYDHNSYERKNRCSYCNFWKSLRAVKLVDCNVKNNQVKLLREYNSKKSAEIIKNQLVQKAVTLSIYNNGVNDNDILQDMLFSICVLNDNDIYKARLYKNKKLQQLSQVELPKLQQDSYNSFALINKNNGIYIDDTMDF